MERGKGERGWCGRERFRGGNVPKAQSPLCRDSAVAGGHLRRAPTVRQHRCQKRVGGGVFSNRRDVA